MNYGISGAFGEVLTAPHFSDSYKGTLDVITSCGYHNVNELYRIFRQDGTVNYLILVTVSGTGKATVGEREYTLKPGKVLIIPPFLPSGYACEAGEKWEFYWMHLEGTNAGRIISRLTSRDYLVHCLSERTVEIMSGIVNRPQSVRDGISAARYVSDVLLSMLEDAESDGGRSHGNDVISAIAEYIDKNYTCRISLGEICASHFISEEYAIRAFKARIGKTPYDYMRTLRMRKAAELLAYTKLPVSEIAESVGYATAAGFGIQFSKEYGLSPIKYRKTNGVYQN